MATEKAFSNTSDRDSILAARNGLSEEASVYLSGQDVWVTLRFEREAD